MLKTLCVVGAISGMAVLQASAVVTSLQATDERPSKGPTLLSDGLVTTGVDAPELLRAFRDAIVNENLLQNNKTKKPFYLTSSEKASPGGGALAVSTEPNDGGLNFMITAYTSIPEAGILASLDIRVSFPQKLGVAEDELARRLAKVNAERRWKIFAENKSIVIQTSLHLPEVTTWDYVRRVTHSHLLAATLFAMENAKTSSPIVD